MKRLGLLVPIILLTEAADVPEHTSNLVDALIAMDHLASELLPAMAQLCECECFSPPCMTRDREGTVYESVVGGSSITVGRYVVPDFAPVKSEEPALGRRTGSRNRGHRFCESSLNRTVFSSGNS
jgi:hypothetical protein